MNIKTINTTIVRKANWTCSVMISVIAIIFLIVSCSKKQADNPAPNPNPNPKPDNEVTVKNVSYSNFAKAFFQNKCASCHGTGASAAIHWTFSDYASVKNRISRINDRVLIKGDMPPGGGLSAKEKELLKAWIDRSVPEN